MPHPTPNRVYRTSLFPSETVAGLLCGVPGTSRERSATKPGAVRRFFLVM